MGVTTKRVSIADRLRSVPRPLWIVLGVALALRVAWVVWVHRDPPTFGDPFIYLNTARGIAQGDGYHVLFSKLPTAFHPIGYPGWLAGVVWVAKSVGLERHESLLIMLVQAVIGTASVALAYAITRRLFDPRVAIVAAALTACFPNLVFYTGLVYSETLHLRDPARSVARRARRLGAGA